MADESMVERVAMALEPEAFDPDALALALQVDARRMARAAIQAMRDETPHQYSHGTQALNAGGNAADIWKTMIDATLDEG